MVSISRICAVIAASTLAVISTPSAFAITPINFSGLTGAVGSAVPSYTESGYTFTSTGGALAVVNYTTTKELGTTSTATVNLTYSGGTFQLNVLGGLSGAGSGTASIGYVGYLGNTQVYSGSLNYSSATGANYVAISSATVDLVKFTLNAGTASNIAFSQTLVTPVAAPLAVPEPATWGMLILGFGLAGGAMRYRRRATTVVFA